MKRRENSHFPPPELEGPFGVEGALLMSSPMDYFFNAPAALFEE